MAGRYICPVCDRRLQMKHFCTYCKSFVKEPVYYTGPVANESYDSGCMADQHYGLGHVHSPLDRQKEYGHHKAGTGAGRNPSVRSNTYVNRSGSVRQAGRSVQQSGRSTQQSGRFARQSGSSVQRAGFGAAVPSRPARGQSAGSSNYGTRPNATQSARSRQDDSGRQARGNNGIAKKLLVIFWVFVLIMVLGQIIFTLIGFQGTGLPGDVFFFDPLMFFAQILGFVFQVGIWGLIVWVIVRNIRRR